MKPITAIIIGLLLLLAIMALLVSGYTADTYTDINSTIRGGYTADAYSDINSTLNDDLTVPSAPPADTCSCPGSGNWNVTIEDNCSVTNCTLSSNILAIIGSAGSFEVEEGNTVYVNEFHRTPDDFDGDFVVNLGNVYVVK